MMFFLYNLFFDVASRIEEKFIGQNGYIFPVIAQNNNKVIFIAKKI
ncbi:MAG: hypothetical protein WC177_00460 [Bacilli bacterium]